MKSTQQKITQCSGMLGTEDLTDFEQSFISSVLEVMENNPSHEFSDKQIQVLDGIYEKYFC